MTSTRWASADKGGKHDQHHGGQHHGDHHGLMVVINVMAIRVLATLITQVENACHWWMPASDTWELGPKMSRRRYQVFRYQGHGTWISRLRTLAIFPCQYQGI